MQAANQKIIEVRIKKGNKKQLSAADVLSAIEDMEESEWIIEEPFNRF